ncbi:hypothetical protein N7466_010043 [Penicillium verhagenii]|uniref:uncharacterized protein n=1 Tax=Penicillium verhagenii TaxID=1562060 RepID=UPI0025452014|nr:uncharacterized protein N7466_010043 [Penicillium verhagenii]KAJ5919100.1 hypothetical protein N7466_010043 [Penicillium verhagenii]
MTFLESEHDHVKYSIKELVELLFHSNVHPNIATQKSNKESEWRGLWRAKLREHQARRLQNSQDNVLDVDEAESFPSESIPSSTNHGDHEMAPNPAITRYPTLPLENPPVPANTPARTGIHAYLNPASTFDIVEDVRNQVAEISTTQNSLENDAQLAPNQPLENMALGVFFSPNQFKALKTVLQFGLQLCALLQVQFGTMISVDGAGNKRKESFLRFKLICGVKFDPSNICISPRVMIILAIALGQLMYILLGPRLSLVLFLIVTLVGSCRTGKKEKIVI